MEYDNTNRGAVWKNDTSGNPKRPVLRFSFEKKQAKAKAPEPTSTFEDVPW